MKKRILSTVLSFALVLTLTGQFAAAGAPHLGLAGDSSIETASVETMADGKTISLDYAAVETRVEPRLYYGSTYVAYGDVVRILYPNATTVWADGQVTVQDQGLKLIIKPNASYIVCNGRYLYVPDKVQNWDGELFVPVRVLCKALGAEVEWDGSTETAVVIPGDGPIASGEEFYDENTLYWLSHIINAESGNQSLQGKIAVGNVVMNRVNSPDFPNTIKKVLYQRNQFTPAMTGSIKRKPNAESIIAAKLVMDGANTAGDSLFFVNPKLAPNCWAARNRPYVTTIGAHAFFA